LLPLAEDFHPGEEVELEVMARWDSHPKEWGDCEETHSRQHQHMRNWNPDR